ncbi:hypothetical protein HYH03_007862 [Edaphochlamys debaryana]|uniref:Uncharacterized protein n=1 Tax=Edaphochlamys debaryana TaxID=47281 RepID=A0A836BYK6_9CHLO|nr:hypothetical protein HYH03_007862 [Edaphochlamys debaryana]|eukprot:KAG2493931.1 hypothetical protein HYH03_007862 [Edaphochlamys debaryana]
MSQAQEPTASQSQAPVGSQPTDAPKVLAGGNMDPTNPMSGMENPEAQGKAEDMGTTIPSQGPPPEVSNEPVDETASGGTETATGSGSQAEAGGGPITSTEDKQSEAAPGSQAPPGSQA